MVSPFDGPELLTTSLRVEFLRRIGVPERVAELDAEGIEHHVSPETLKAFRRILRGR